jgi:alkylation response protein AidB-like acyl-CoA dehydrogenase
MGHTIQEKPEIKEPDHDLAASAAGDNIQKRQAIEVTEEARLKEYKLPTFGGQLFMGQFDPSLMFPYPQQSEKDRKEGEVIIELLMDFLRKNLDPDEVDATRTIPQHVIDEMGKMGIFALKIPKEYGGLGLSQTNYNRLVMNVASYCAGTATLISAHQSIGVPQPFKLFGTEEQKRKYFPRFRQGAISAFALTEPDVGSDPAQMSCTAQLSEDGKYYILNGEKLWCTNGVLAEVIVVMAKTAPKIVKGKERKQITAFILEMKTPGVEIVHRCEFMGLGGIYNALLRFTNVKIPVENVIASEGRGLAIALATVNVGRLTLPAASTGAAKQCLKIARIWGSQRIQWGMPVGLHETGREKIAYIAATTMAMEAVTWLTSAWADLQNVDIRIEAAMAKLFCTESLWKIVDMTMQLRGGRGYEKARSLKARGEAPYPVERIMRDCRINTILEGSSEIMKLFLAREAIDPHLKRAGDLLNPAIPKMQKVKTAFNLFNFYSLWYAKQWLASKRKRPFKDMGELEEHYQFIDKSSHRLSLEIFKAMMTYKQHLERKQLLLGRLMEIGSDLFAMAAVCSYAISLKEQKHVENALELAHLFCTLARRRIQDRFHAIAHNDDKTVNQTAKKVLDEDFKWLEAGVASIPGE